MRDPSRPWWERPGLEIRDGGLLVAGRDAEELARRHGTPPFVYDLVRLEEQARSLVEAFARAGVPFRLRLALKAQRDPQVLVFVQQLGWVGIDACSPGEVLHALEHGWARRRSATPARTCPSATSTCCWRTPCTSTSICCLSSSASGAARPASRSGSG